MSDIIERLRDYDLDVPNALAQQTADEIERLRAALQGCLSVIDGEDVSIVDFARYTREARRALEGK
jgi:hypothetical protein